MDCQEFACVLKQGAAQDDGRDGKIDHQTGDIHQGGDKRRRALAGSKPRERRMNGRIEPINEPHITTPTKLKPTVRAMRK